MYDSLSRWSGLGRTKTRELIARQAREGVEEWTSRSRALGEEMRTPCEHPPQRRLLGIIWAGWPALWGAVTFFPILQWAASYPLWNSQFSYTSPSYHWGCVSKTTGEHTKAEVTITASHTKAPKKGWDLNLSLWGSLCYLPRSKSRVTVMAGVMEADYQERISAK